MKDDSASYPRRHFVGRTSAALAALFAGVPLAAGATISTPASPAEHDAWMKSMTGKHRQFFHAWTANDAAMLMANNYLDSYVNEFGAKPTELSAAIGVHGPALALGFTDATWAKYALGKVVNVTDPTTKEPAVRNIFASGGSLSVDATQKRGVAFLLCNNALRRLSRTLATEGGPTAETIYEDLKASRLPGTIVVPALVIAINRAQEAGFTYVRV